ncbi:hypothetical protein C8R47DRAFT_1162391 [Mycena vitilis]|nr:hypothetical protein C8R47DRAFT_1162391 [Mycena vitilis]
MDTANASIDILAKPGFRQRDPVETFHNLGKIMGAIHSCPLPQFKARRIIEILSVYSAPEGAKKGDAVRPERTRADLWQSVFSGACITSLFNIAMRFQGTDIWKDILPHLIAAWPTTQVALQLHARMVFDKNRPQVDLGVDITPYNAFKSILIMLQMYSVHDALAELVRKTPAVVDLVIKFWAMEVRDPEIRVALAAEFPPGLVAPPGASRCLNRLAFTLDDGPENTIKWGPLFANALGGTLADNAALVLTHIKDSLARMSPSQTGIDLNTSTEALTTDLRNLHYFHYTPMRDQLVAQQSVGAVIKALSALTSRPFNHLDAAATAAGIVLVCDYLRQHIADDGVTFVVMAMEADLLQTLLKCFPWLDDTTLASFKRLLCEELPKYTIYISVLRPTHKALAAITSAALDKRLRGEARQAWLAFRLHVDKCTGFCSEEDLLKPKPCGGANCTENGTQLCSGCLQTSFCSRTCQVAAWKSHKTTCKTRERERGAGTVPPLAQDDIEFACRIAQAGFEAHREQLIKELAAMRPAAPILVELDYTIYPGPKLKVISSPRPLPFPTVRPIIMFHADFPKGKDETELHIYFLLEFDEDKGSGMKEVDKAIKVLEKETLERMYGVTKTCQSCICLPGTRAW